MRQRRSRGFVPIGNVSLGETGLRKREARRLLLQHAWRQVAGEPLAGRLAVERVVGATLLLAADPRWAASLGNVVPTLVGRLVHRFPELGIKRFRLEVAGQPGPAASPQPVTPDPTGDRRDAVRNPPEVAADEGSSDLEPHERLERVARRYLARRDGHSPR